LEAILRRASVVPPSPELHSYLGVLVSLYPMTSVANNGQLQSLIAEAISASVTRYPRGFTANAIADLELHCVNGHDAHDISRRTVALLRAIANVPVARGHVREVAHADAWISLTLQLVQVLPLLESASASEVSRTLFDRLCESTAPSPRLIDAHDCLRTQLNTLIEACATHPSSNAAAGSLFAAAIKAADAPWQTSATRGQQRLLVTRHCEAWLAAGPMSSLSAAEQRIVLRELHGAKIHTVIVYAALSPLIAGGLLSRERTATEQQLEDDVLVAARFCANCCTGDTPCPLPLGFDGALADAAQTVIGGGPATDAPLPLRHVVTMLEHSSAINAAQQRFADWPVDVTPRLVDTLLRYAAEMLRDPLGVKRHGPKTAKGLLRMLMAIEAVAGRVQLPMGLLPGLMECASRVASEGVSADVLHQAWRELSRLSLVACSAEAAAVVAQLVSSVQSLCASSPTAALGLIGHIDPVLLSAQGSLASATRSVCLQSLTNGGDLQRVCPIVMRMKWDLGDGDFANEMAEAIEKSSAITGTDLVRRHSFHGAALAACDVHSALLALGLAESEAALRNGALAALQRHTGWTLVSEKLRRDVAATLGAIGDIAAVPALTSVTGAAAPLRHDV
jgi:hypothetical protein